MNMDEIISLSNRILEELSRVVIGKKDEVKIILATVYAGGHILIEGPPGTAKTLLVKSIARVFHGEFKRVQGNPDLLPTDLTGYYIYRLDGTRTFIRGPVFSNFLMFDELNRTPPRVQSALLEALAEGQVSIDGVTHRLPEPFHVFATEVPVDVEVGVYPLTITLRDRFWTRIHVEYNSPSDEVLIASNSDKLYLSEPDVKPVSTIKILLDVKDFLASGVFVDEKIVRYMVDIITSMRKTEEVLIGPSHRATIHLYRVSKAYALINGRDYVIPDDVKEVARYVVPHKIVLKREFELKDITPMSILNKVLGQVEVPK